MKLMKKTFVAFGLLALLSSFSFADEKQYDKETGLIVDSGVEVVKTNCTVCHSAKFITLQRGNRQTWLDMIRWMQETQGLWEFDPKTEKIILDYLEKNYAPSESSRRPNLSKDLLPK